MPDHARDRIFQPCANDINLGRGKIDGVKTMQATERTIRCVAYLRCYSYVTLEDEKHFLKMGFDGYVAKTIERKDLPEYLPRFFA